MIFKVQQVLFVYLCICVGVTHQRMYHPVLELKTAIKGFAHCFCAEGYEFFLRLYIRLVHSRYLPERLTPEACGGSGMPSDER